MSSSLRVRPSTAANSPEQTGRFDYNESGRLSSDSARKLLGEKCILNQTQLEELTDGLCALADFAVTVFVEQRKRCKTAASEQPMPILEVTEPVSAVN